MIGPIQFRSCTLAVRDDHVEVQFHKDGSTSRAYWDFADDGSHLEATRFCGYGDDRRRMVLEHEVGHCLVADALGWPHSWSVWSHAHGTGMPGRPWSQRVADEEHLVVRLQRYANTGAPDEYGNLEAAFGRQLPALAYQLIWLARPWLFRRAA
jgi:hypothetical protein